MARAEALRRGGKEKPSSGSGRDGLEWANSTQPHEFRPTVLNLECGIRSAKCEMRMGIKTELLPDSLRALRLCVSFSEVEAGMDLTQRRQGAEKFDACKFNTTPAISAEGVEFGAKCKMPSAKCKFQIQQEKWLRRRLASRLSVSWGDIVRVPEFILAFSLCGPHD